MRISYSGPQGTIANPLPGVAQAVGDSFPLRFVAVHLLKRTVMRSHLPQTDLRAANPYLCQTGIAPRLLSLFGA